MDGDRHHEKQHLAQLRVAVGLLLLRGDHFMQVRHQLIDKVKAECTDKHGNNGDENAVFPALFNGGEDESQHRGGKHHACSEGQNYIGKFM